MATEIVTRTLCDFCMADDRATDGAETLSVSLNGSTWEIDVCAEHRKPLDDLGETLSAHGRKIPRTGATKATKPSAQPGDHRCPVCGKLYTYRSSLTSHVRDVHGQTIGEAEGVPLDYPCDQCERAFSTPQGVAVHRNRVHSAT